MKSYLILISSITSLNGKQLLQNKVYSEMDFDKDHVSGLLDAKFIREATPEEITAGCLVEKGPFEGMGKQKLLAEAKKRNVAVPAEATDAELIILLQASDPV